MISDEKLNKFQTIIDDIRAKSGDDITKYTIANIMVLHDIALESYYTNLEDWRNLCLLAKLDVDDLISGKYIEVNWIDVFDSNGNKIGKVNKVYGEFVELG